MIEMQSPATLATKWAELKEQNPQMRIRNAAEALGVTEAALLATQLNDTVTLLEGDWKALLQEVKNLGKVMALTRNHGVVHERKGVYNNVSFQGPVGLVLDPAIDLRLFMQSWTFAFAVNEPQAKGPARKSIQFFNGKGEAIHKIYLTPFSDQTAFDALVEKYTAKTQDYPTFSTESRPPMPSLQDAAIDQEGFKSGWMGLKDTHDFYHLLRQFNVGRVQALRLAPEGMTQRLQANAFREVLDHAAQKEVDIMVFVGNPGCIQIHTGPVNHIMPHQDWYNVMDPDFNLHIHEPAITECWLVKKPTSDGIVTAVECYDAKGELLVQFFGKRKPGIPELDTWRQLCTELTPLA